MNQNQLSTIIKVLLSVLFLICLLNMPYGYFQFVRFSAMLGFALLAYFSYEKNQILLVIVFVSLALLFQPFVKVALGRSLWNLVDVILAIWLLGSLVLEYMRKKKMSKEK